MRIDEPDLTTYGQEEVSIKWHLHGFRSVDPGGLLQLDPPSCARAAVIHAWLAIDNEWRRASAQRAAWNATSVRELMDTINIWFTNADPAPGVSQIRSYARRQIRHGPL